MLPSVARNESVYSNQLYVFPRTGTRRVTVTRMEADAGTKGTCTHTVRRKAAPLPLGHTRADPETVQLGQLVSLSCPRPGFRGPRPGSQLPGQVPPPVLGGPGAKPGFTVFN